MKRGRVITRVLGNIIWFLTAGLISAILWGIAGLLLCITIIGIPFGVQCFKLAVFSLFPFGKDVSTHFHRHPIGNFLWMLLCGWEIAIVYFVSGMILCITVVGIPFGIQCFKLMGMAIMPMGAEISYI